MLYEYKTVAENYTGDTITEKGSRFIPYIYRVESDEEIKKCLADIKQLHPKATHHCFSYRIGNNGEFYRANDDGEPSGTAGLPIYNQLLAFGVTNILLVVVRYFGGTNLGASGLIKAYKNSAKSALEYSQIVTKKIQAKIEVIFPFELQNKIFAIINRYKAQIINFSAEDSCSLLFEIHLEEMEKIESALKEISHEVVIKE